MKIETLVTAEQAASMPKPGEVWRVVGMSFDRRPDGLYSVVMNLDTTDYERLVEDATFERNKRLSRRWRSASAIVSAIWSARPVVNVTNVRIPPSATDPDRPRS